MSSDSIGTCSVGRVHLTTGGSMVYRQRLLTPEEWLVAWESDEQGNKQAKARGNMCVIVPCDKIEQAVIYANLFFREFAIASCSHWNGNTLSMYCGDAGGGYQSLMGRARVLAGLTEGD